MTAFAAMLRGLPPGLGGEALGCKTGETKIGVGANALTGLAGKILPNSRIASFEGVIRDPGLLNSEF